MRLWHLLVTCLAIITLLVVGCAQPASPATPTKAPAEKPAGAPTAAAPAASPAAAAPAAKSSGDKSPVVIGAVLSLVGPAGAVGGTAKQGIDIALDEINAKGGIDGHPVQFVVEDDEGDPAKATTATTKLIQKDKAVAILGAAVTATTVAAAQVANAEKVVILSPMFTGDQLTAPGSGMDYVFRVGLPDRYTVGKLVQYGGKKYSKIGIIGDSGPAGQSVTAVATKGLKDLGKEPVGAQSFDTRAPDLTPQLLNLQKAGAEAIIAQAVPGDAPTILKGLKQIGWNVQLLGHLGFSDPTIRNVALDASQGVYGIDSYDPDNPNQQRIIEAHKKKFGADKLVYWGAVMQGYDSMMVLAEGVKKGNFDRTKVKDALESIKDFPAVSGNKDNKISFGPGQHDGNGQNSVILLQVKGKDLIKIE